MAIPAFVEVRGTQFILDGEPFYAAGCNNYYLIYKSQYMVNAVLDAAKALSLSVIRTWGFLAEEPKEGVCFQFWDSTSGQPAYNDGPNGLQRLDYVLYAARERGLKLIIPLVNNWNDFGGMDQYVRWYGLASHDEFYTDAAIRQGYKDWVSYVLNRLNIYTGEPYKDDPTVMAWELANEPRCQSSSALLSWVEEMSLFFKQNDPRHLVATGDEGFYDPGAFLMLPNIDFGTFHMYPETWGKSTEWATSWIEEHLAAGSRAGKPVLLEEYGLKDRALRDTAYREWVETVKQNGGAGDLFWMLAAQQDDGSLYPDYDGFTVYNT